jgi:inosine-uridine nucleoside N-ribohydrolase
MKRSKFSLTISLRALLCLWLVGLTAGVVQGRESVRIILDTDISSDADDVGAVAVLHALAARDGVEILAMMVSSGDPYSAGCLSVLNNYFRRPEIPVGKVSGPSVRHDSTYTRALASSDKTLRTTEKDAVELYREILAQQPDQSVTIVSVGYLTNLKNLLLSRADEFSPLGGKDLVQQKVRLLVCMGGEYPSGREWNFYQDAASTRYTVMHWPGRIVFAGFELGKDIITGKDLGQVPKDSPVRLSYQLHNDFQGRPSWDQLAVLYAAQDKEINEGDFRLSRPGVNRVKKDGSNQWDDDPRANHFYLSLNRNSEEISRVIDTMMGRQR